MVKDLLSSKSGRLAKDLFQYCIALMPILHLLNLPLLNISIGTVLILLFLPYSSLYVASWFMQKERDRNNFITIILFATFYLYLCLRSGGSLNTIVMSLATLVHIAGMLCGSVQLNKICKIIVTFAMISVGLVVIQTLACYLLGWRIQFVPSFIVHEQFRGSYIFRNDSGLFRPSALFLEPSHFVQYCIFAIISLLFPSEGKRDLQRAIVIAIGCVLTTSGMGMALVFGIALWYFVLEFLVSGKIKNYSRKHLVYAGVAVFIGLVLLIQIPFVKIALMRVFSTVDGYNAIVGRLGLWKLRDAIGTMNFGSLLFGYNNTADYGYYLTGMVDTIYKFGLFGLLLEVGCFGWLMYRKRNNFVWGTSLTFLMLFAVAHLTSSFDQLFYFGLIIAEVVLLPEKEHREKVSLDQVKEIGFRILSDVTDFCDKHEIQYFLACGTALGAIRHNGFIPWDDDVDICMPREDYERFLEIFASEQYELYDARYQKNYPYAFAKVCDRKTELVEHIEDPCKFGIYIDIFPLDGIPSDELLQKRFMKKLNWDFRFLAWKRMPRDKKLDIPHKLILLAVKSVLHIIPVRFFVRKLDQDVKKYCYKECDYVGHLVSPAPWGTDIKPKAVFENPVRHIFEDREFFVPGDVDQYLTLEYGDYMQLPPKEKQVLKHDFLAYYKGEQD